MHETLAVKLKLFASLTGYLPSQAHRNCIETKVQHGTTVQDLLDDFKVPREVCHLVMLNGVFQSPGARLTKVLTNGDAVAVWPPVAGG